nr:MAG TPA: hypothetical protein [Caudoviricetes sp.]
MLDKTGEIRYNRNKAIPQNKTFRRIEIWEFFRESVIS